jgi:hypothetical protein
MLSQTITRSNSGQSLTTARQSGRQAIQGSIGFEWIRDGHRDARVIFGVWQHDRFGRIASAGQGTCLHVRVEHDPH